jgi:hypothetical protein
MNDAILKQVYEDDDEDSSKEWERIKGFVGGANKTSKHPLQQELDRKKMREPEHFAEGGSVMDDYTDFKPKLSLAPSTTDQILNTPPQQPVIPPVNAPQAPIVPPMGQNPTPPGSAQPAPVSAPSGTSYDDQASKVLGGMTPEKLEQLRQTVNSQSKPPLIGAGIAGIGDAIASVGGVKGEHMKDTMNSIQQNKEMRMKLPGEMAAMGKEQYGISNELQAKDPASPYSKIVQNSYRGTLKEMGATDQDVNKMPASTIHDVVSGRIEFKKAMAEIENTAEFRKATLAQTSTNQREQRKQGAAKGLADLGLVGGMVHPEVRKEYESELNQGTTEFNHAEIAPGTKYQAPDGTWRIKK